VLKTPVGKPAADYIKTLDAFRASRSQHEDVWRRCFDVSFPLRGDGLQGSITSAQDALTRLAARRDSTATDAGEQLAANIMGGLTPANSLWFDMDAGNETPEERRWLSSSSRTIWENIHASNYDSAGYDCAIDIVGAGWFVLYIEEGKQGGYTFEQWPIGQCFVHSTRRDGRVDMVYRLYRRSADQLVSEFGEEAVSDDVRRLVADGKGMTSVEVLRVIEPRELYTDDALLSVELPIRSCTYEVKGKHLLRESGYHEFPCVVPRWSVIPGTCYAVGPMFKVLPDVNQLNDLVAKEDAATELAIAPLFKATDDGVLNPATVKIGRGGRRVIVVGEMDNLQPINTGADFRVSFTKREILQQQIRRALMADQLQPQDGPAMTATEVHARMAIVRQLMGPAYGRLQAEWLQPMIERCFGIAFRAGVLGEPPESLLKKKFTVRYLSPMARSQKLEDVTSMDRLEADLVATAANTQIPDLLDVYDFEAAKRHKSELLGVEGKFMRDQKAVDKIRAARQQAQAQAQQQEVALQGQASVNDAMAQRLAAA